MQLKKLVMTTKKMYFIIFTYISKQKDVIISELNDKSRILNEHIDLLKKYQSKSIGEWKKMIKD